MMPLPGLSNLSRMASAPSSSGSLGATWNPADKHADIVLTNGNLSMYAVTASGWKAVRATHAISGTEKKYWEIIIDDILGGPSISGIADGLILLDDLIGRGGAKQAGIRVSSGNFVDGITLANTPASLNAAVGDVIMFARFGDNSFIGKNGVWFGTPASDPGANTDPNFTGYGTGDMFPASSSVDKLSSVVTLVPDEPSQTYALPTGYKAYDTV